MANVIPWLPHPWAGHHKWHFHFPLWRTQEDQKGWGEFWLSVARVGGLRSGSLSTLYSWAASRSHWLFGLYPQGSKDQVLLNVRAKEGQDLEKDTVWKLYNRLTFHSLPSHLLLTSSFSWYDQNATWKPVGHFYLFYSFLWNGSKLAVLILESD